MVSGGWNSINVVVACRVGRFYCKSKGHGVVWVTLLWIWKLVVAPWANALALPQWANMAWSNTEKQCSIPSHSHTRMPVSRSLHQVLLLCDINKMKNFKRRFSLSVPRTETIEENEFTEQINQLNIQHTQGKTSNTTLHCPILPVQHCPMTHRKSSHLSSLYLVGLAVMSVANEWQLIGTIFRNRKLKVLIPDLTLLPPPSLPALIYSSFY